MTPYLRAYVLGYLGERSKMSSQHKLATADEIISSAEKYFPNTRDEIFEILRDLVTEGKLLQYGPHYSTDDKRVL